MVDISVIEPYIVEKDDVYYDEAKSSIIKQGFDRWFNNQIKNWINCTTLSSDGRRLLQTNDKRYNYEITTTILLIDEYGENNKDKYYSQLITQHNKNLEFEAIHGFKYDPYSTKKTKSSSSSRKKSKQTSLELEDKPKRETAAERKLKAHAAKISMLKIKIKSANNDNII